MQTPARPGQDTRPTNSKSPANPSPFLKEMADKAKKGQENTHTLKGLAEEVKRRKEEQEEVMLQRVPLLYRAFQVACDVKSKTFGAVQNDPRIG